MMMNVLNTDVFILDILDKTKEGIEQHREQKYLKCAISKEKVYLVSKK